MKEGIGPHEVPRWIVITVLAGPLLLLVGVVAVLLHLDRRLALGLAVAGLVLALAGIVLLTAHLAARRRELGAGWTAVPVEASSPAPPGARTWSLTEHANGRLVRALAVLVALVAIAGIAVVLVLGDGPQGRWFPLVSLVLVLALAVVLWQSQGASTTVDDESVVVRTGFGTRTVPRSRITALEVTGLDSGHPAGGAARVLVADDRPVVLPGVTAAHLSELVARLAARR